MILFKPDSYDEKSRLDAAASPKGGMRPLASEEVEVGPATEQRRGKGVAKASSDLARVPSAFEGSMQPASFRAYRVSPTGSFRA